MEIRGAAALVAGGASGLGKATAQRLAQAGARVTIFDIDESLGPGSASEIGARFVRLDVTDDEAVGAAIADAEEFNGKATFLVNCAGIGPPAKAVDRNGVAGSLAQFSRTLSVNLIGTFNVLSKFAARLHDSEPASEERGIIINTSSVAAYEGQIGQAAYAASKGGIVSMTLPLAREFARLGIRVVTIAPGLFLTPLLASLPEEAQESLGKQVPFPARLGLPGEYAQLVEAIVTNPMLNGETIRLDGAIRMAPR